MMTSSTNIVSARRDRTAPLSRSFILSGNRTGLLLVHGFAGSIADLRVFGEKLHQRYGYTVVGVRLAGHGATVTDLQRSTAEDWLAAARNGLHRLQSMTDRVVIVGESMGALIGIRLAHESSKVAGLILLAPAFRVAHQRVRQLISFVAPAGMRMRKTWVDDVRAQRGSLKQVTVGSFSQLMRLVRDEDAGSKAIAHPTLMMFAEDDPIGDPSFLKTMTGSGSVEVERVSAATHHLNESNDVDRLVDRMHTFISAHV